MTTHMSFDERRLRVFVAGLVLAGTVGLWGCDGANQAATEDAGDEAPAAATESDTPASQTAAEDHSAHDGHAMTEAQLAELRAKIPLYQEYSDEEIAASMERMAPDYGEYLSDASLTGEIGVLVLGHGFREVGDALFKSSLDPIADAYPTSVGLGMNMMDSGHLQAQVDRLIAAGAKTVVVVPVSMGTESSLIQQWDYIFGRADESAYLDVPRVTTTATVVMAPTPTHSPILSRVLRDYAVEISADPANEVVIVIGHGPTDAEHNALELAAMETHAQYIRDNSDLDDVRVATLQDDAPRAIRAANVERIRGWIEEATADGRTVLVINTLPTQGAVQGRIANDLKGLAYKGNMKGLVEHPAFVEWVEETVRRETGEM